MFYTAKTPAWVRKLFKGFIWEVPGRQKNIFLTFDDGPHPYITPFVLDELAAFGAKATFFCIGRNVADNPAIYQRILAEGHAVGNHTFNHLNGWKTPNDQYLENILKAGEYIESRLFRPPYGRITPGQMKELKQQQRPFDIVMWSVLSGDFDTRITGEQCSSNVIRNAGNGSVIVFHDSEKAAPRLRYALPEVLQYFSSSGFTFEKLVESA
jgi:peptidoglycan/xylan/chitin deacetylase (PgdA/CDA1 family)